MTRVVHYVNQFFAGRGGEAQADLPIAVVRGPLGPGRLLAQKLAGWGQIVATVYGGDNAWHERPEATVREALAAIRDARAELLVAGPAFDAGRYGLACGRLAATVGRELGIPVVIACSVENPAVEEYRSLVTIVPTADSAIGMADALDRVVPIARKLALGIPLGPAAEEGYVPTGRRLNHRGPIAAPTRAADLLVARLRDSRVETEIPIERFEVVPPPPPLPSPAGRTIALVTEAGVIPRGNPDRIPVRRAGVWGRYSLANRDTLAPADFDVSHGGYNTIWVREDPNRALPVDSLRELERAGVIGRLHDVFYGTCGNAGTVSTMQRIGAEIAGEVAGAGVDGVILTAT